MLREVYVPENSLMQNTKLMILSSKPKNPRTARILKAREPQLIEGPKRTLILHGQNARRRSTPS
jgi:Uncharacterized conserved protein